MLLGAGVFFLLFAFPLQPLFASSQQFGFSWAPSVTLALAWFQVSLADTVTDLSVLVFLFSFIPFMYIRNSIFIYIRGSLASPKNRPRQLPDLASTSTTY